MAVTGPGMLTTTSTAYASQLTGTSVSHLNFTALSQPKMIGEVLVLPIQAWGADHKGETAGLASVRGDALLKHHFDGTWKAAHGGDR